MMPLMSAISPVTKFNFDSVFWNQTRLAGEVKLGPINQNIPEECENFSIVFILVYYMSCFCYSMYPISYTF